MKKLSLNHLNKLLDAFSRESLKSSTLLADVNGVLSSAMLAIFTSFKTKNKSARNILNKSGPNIDPWGTPSIISHQSLNEFPILVRCFLLDK